MTLPKHAAATALLGKNVRVTLDTRSGNATIASGVLLGFGQCGEFELLQDDGYVHYCWPMLDIEEVTNE